MNQILQPDPFLAEEANLTHSDHLRFAGLSLDVRMETAKYFAWARGYFAPFFAYPLQAFEPSRGVEVAIDIVHSDEIVAWAIERVAQDKPEKTPGIHGGRNLSQIRLEDGSRLILSPYRGLVFRLNPTAARIQAAYASQAPYPGNVLCDLVEEVLIRYLEGEGWCVFHAGAVATRDGVVVVMGGGGSGKTTLIGGLVRVGMDFIANERCFLKAGPQGVEAMAFPQLVNVGIGTAWQFPTLDALLADQSRLTQTQGRFRSTHVAQTPRAEQAALKDKLSLSSQEFSRLIAGTEPIIGGRVVGIVQPHLDLKAAALSWQALDRQELAALLEKNNQERGQDPYFPNWLGLAFPPAPPPFEALNDLPAGRLTFQVDGQGFPGAPDPVGQILERLRG